MTIRPTMVVVLAGVLASLAAASGRGEEPVLIDRVLAVVDEDPILQSEVSQVVALRMVERSDGEGDRALRRRILDRLIEQRLRFHEIDSFGFVELPTADVEDGYERIRQRFDSDEAFLASLDALGLDPESLRQLVARQLMVLTYVDERLGPRVFVDLEDIRAYYDETFVPEMRRRGVSAEPLQRVREQIRAVLKQERLNEEIDRWTEELRQRADVEDYFDAAEGGLPEVVAAVEEPASSG